MELFISSRCNDAIGATPGLMPLDRPKKTRHRASAIVLLLTVSACNPAPHPPPADVLGQVPLAPAGPRDVPESFVYRAPDLDTRPAPRCFYIPPTEIDARREAIFLGVTDRQKQIVADAVTAAFRQAVGRNQRVSTVAEPDCATLQLYLTGVTKSVPSSDAGSDNPYSNLIGQTSQGGRNLQASINGTITVAGKFVTSHGDVIAGFVNKISTNSFDIPPNANPEQIAKLGAARIANDIANTVDREVLVQKRNQAR